jgi:transposase InsO family protein
MRIIDEEFMEDPTYGSRTMRYVLRRRGYAVSRKRIQRLMRKMGLKAIYREPKTSIPNLEHKIYPYLLSNLTIDRPNQVWCTDITYIPMRRGLQRWFSRYNAVRPHDSLHGATPDEAYFAITPPGVSTLKGAA